jgi:hypothetical protein
MRESMIIYRSFYEAIKDLPAEDAAKVWNAVFDYGLNGNAQELSGIALTIFTLIKPQLDANIRKFENGTKGGRPKKETKPKPKPNLTESKPKGNDNDNEELQCKLEYKEWFDLWFSYKSEKRQTYKPIAKKQLIRSMESKYTPAQFKSAVEYSISQNYQGIFEPKQEVKTEPRSPQYKKATL